MLMDLLSVKLVCHHTNLLFIQVIIWSPALPFLSYSVSSVLHTGHVQAKYWVLNCDPVCLFEHSPELELEWVVMVMEHTHLGKICILRVVRTFKEVLLYQLVMW